MDETVKIIARGVHGKLTGVKTQRIAIGRFFYQGAITPLGAYWMNQLSGELANIPGRPYTILSGGFAGADWTISGEIVVMPGIIRIYTRMVRSEGRAIEASFNSGNF